MPLPACCPSVIRMTMIRLGLPTFCVCHAIRSSMRS